MLTLKQVRATNIYKALMQVPGVELMEIDKELQCVDRIDGGTCELDAAFVWYKQPQGEHFWKELYLAQCNHHGVADWSAIPCA